MTFCADFFYLAWCNLLYQYFFPFRGWVIFHSMDRPHLGIFPDFWRLCVYCFCECSCASLHTHFCIHNILLLSHMAIWIILNNAKTLNKLLDRWTYHLHSITCSSPPPDGTLRFQVLKLSQYLSCPFTLHSSLNSFLNPQYLGCVLKSKSLFFFSLIEYHPHHPQAFSFSFYHKILVTAIKYLKTLSGSPLIKVMY